MKVGLVNGGFALDKVAGSELQTMFLGQALASAGDEAHYIAISSSVAEPSISHEAGLTVHRLHKSIPWGRRRAALEGLVRDLALDVLYVRIIGWLPDCLAVARSAGVGVVAQLSSDLDLQPQTRWSALLGLHLRELRQALEHDAGMRAFESGDYVIAQTSSQLETLRRTSDVPATVIRNMLPEPAWRVERASPDTVVWVGSVKWVKRPEIFVRLAESLSDTGARFLMIGEAQDSERGEMVRAAATRLAGLEYSGPIEFEAAWREIAASVVLVNTSSAEGFPNTFIQAWATGVPVVSLGVDPDGVIERENLGAVARDESELQECVRRYIEDDALRSAVGARSCEYAMREHSLATNAARFREVLMSVARRPR